MSVVDPPFVSRRAFLRAGAATSALALCDVGAASAQSPGRAKNCIVLFLVGGPSQLETWDPKPDAPSDVRGPFRSIATNAAGVRISEHLPAMAKRAHRYAIVRTIHHAEAPVHEAGMQLLQTGRISPPGFEFPHFGAVLAQQGALASSVILPTRIGNMGINISRGQGAGFLGAAHEPQLQGCLTPQLPPTDRERYGKTPFGDACLQARQLVEQGVCCVTVNMFESAYDRVTWDCHADRHGLASTLDDYRRTLCPTLDRACAALLDDLHERGLLEETLVLALGELGRTPHLNANSGRDHWAGCWSIVMAGGGVRGGQIIGASDRLAAAPAVRPVTCAEIVATIYHAMGVSPASRLIDPDHRAWPLVDAAPIHELFT